MSCPRKSLFTLQCINPMTEKNAYLLAVCGYCSKRLDWRCAAAVIVGVFSLLYPTSWVKSEDCTILSRVWKDKKKINTIKYNGSCWKEKCYHCCWSSFGMFWEALMRSCSLIRWQLIRSQVKDIKSSNNNKWTTTSFHLLSCTDGNVLSTWAWAGRLLKYSEIWL